MWKSAGIAALLYIFGSGTVAAQQCDFLSPDYFSRVKSTEDSAACLQRGYTLSIQDRETLETPLHLAVRYTDDTFLFDQLALLMPKDQRQNLVSWTNKDGLSPFLLAVAINRNPAVAVALVKWGDVVNSQINPERSFIGRLRGKTALHIAADRKIPNIEMVTTLLALGVDPSITDKQGNPPYFYARNAANNREMALLLDNKAWRAMITETYTVSENSDATKKTASNDELCADFWSVGFFQRTSAINIWNCTKKLANAQSNPTALWLKTSPGGDNALHLALKADIGREKLSALLAAAELTGGLETALSSEDGNGWSPLHIAASQSSDPLNIVALARWGADVNRIANGQDNGFLKSKTGTTPLHLATQRKDAEKYVAALLAVGANPYVYDNNTNDNPSDDPVGTTPLDYLSLTGNLNAMALIAPPFSVCAVVKDNTAVLASIAGLGAGATGTSVAATTGVGITAVTHSSGAIILTGSSGYIAGTLGSVGATALSILTAPATLTAAAITVVALGGTVYYCSIDSSS
jgi:ankyrin repeat protein